MKAYDANRASGSYQEGSTDTMQIGIVVRDLEATVRKYEDDYGIGSWEFAQIDAGEANDYCEYGQPVERSTCIASTVVGQVMWELIEPLDEEDIFMSITTTTDTQPPTLLSPHTNPASPLRSLPKHSIVPRLLER